MSYPGTVRDWRPRGNRSQSRMALERKRPRVEREDARGREVEMEIHDIGPALWRSEEQPKVFQSETFAYNDFGK